MSAGATIDETWSIEKSEELYAIRHWGKGYFAINAKGNVSVHPDKDPNRSIDLKQLIDELRQRELHPPVLIRFPGILRHRLGEIHAAFNNAIKENSYQAPYRCVYPIKVNQQAQVLEEILDFGKEYGFGVEAGSKPELLAVIAMVDDDTTPIICNGFKDSEYIEAVVIAQKLGKLIIPVVEKFNELELIVEHSRQHGIEPMYGVRVRLASKGSGRWQESGGAGAKFGLTVDELLEALEYAKSKNIQSNFKLLHFHIGSQITNIRSIKAAINEAARIYVELAKAGAGLEYLDVGGGLAIDYDGSQTNFGSSMNYTLPEYAADVVFGIQSVCDQAEIAHPTIISESGRAVAGYHSILVFNVLGVSQVGSTPPPPRPSEEVELPQPIASLYDTLNDVSSKNVLEMYHDAVQHRDDALNLFKLGYMSLAERSVVERLFWAICKSIHRICAKLQHVPEELQSLELILADTYFCNFSLFQSMPDCWAVNQLFPIMPIHRHLERPERRATLGDITCDSDGKIDSFVDLRDVKKVLELHPLNGADYYLSAFLVGAYQETLGDLHNLFGDTHAVHVSIDESGRAFVDTVVEGETVREVLEYVQFSPNELSRNLRREVEKALRKDRITTEEAGRLLKFYAAGLDGYTYLE